MVETDADTGGHEAGERAPFLPILFGGLVLVGCLALLWAFAAALRPPAGAVNPAPVSVGHAKAHDGVAIMLKGLHS